MEMKVVWELIKTILDWLKFLIFELPQLYHDHPTIVITVAAILIIAVIVKAAIISYSERPKNKRPPQETTPRPESKTILGDGFTMTESGD